jgi:hypothetical protein
METSRLVAVKPNALALRRGPFLAAAWSGWFGLRMAHAQT